MTLLYLVRHAESVADLSLPNARWPLSPRGRVQAQALARCFDGVHVDEVVASPYPRAIDTVAPLAGARELPVRAVHGLREHELAATPVPDVEPLIRAAWADVDLVQSGGESARACQTRMQACLGALARTAAAATQGPAPGRTPVLVAASHGNAIGFFLSGVDPSFGYPQWVQMRRPDVFLLRYNGQRWTREHAYQFELPPAS